MKRTGEQAFAVLPALARAKVVPSFPKMTTCLFCCSYCCNSLS